jgi:two-component system sensor histidine kinase UhpB
MSLRTQINLLVAAMTAIFVVALLAMHLEATRNSVRAEVEAGNRVATQLFANLVPDDGVNGQGFSEFLSRLGHVRATMIRLHDRNGGLIYASPPDVRKPGREPPRWYADLVAPEPVHRSFQTPEGVLDIDADPISAIRDGWDNAVHMFQFGAAIFVLGNLLVFALVQRATQPFARIARGLDEVQRGDLRARLPTYWHGEAGTIAQAFNRMTRTIEENLDARQEALEARLRLDSNRELAETVRVRIEDERREIARELHDETGQSVTAIKSLALALVRRTESDEATRTTAQLIADTAGKLYAAMHGVIPRLRPLTLDSLGLADALREQVGDWRRQQPAVDITLELAELPALGETATVTVYRIVQEAVTNALRHANAKHVGIELGANTDAVSVRIVDDGVGLADDWHQAGHYGLRGIVERAQALGGEARIGNREPRGAAIEVSIPLQR